jgi:hypothetical protein
MGCGASSESTEAPAKYEAVVQLAGKEKFIIDAGAHVFHHEEKKHVMGLCVVFSPRTGPPGIIVGYADRTAKAGTAGEPAKLYGLHLTDPQLEKLRTEQEISFGWSAIFKSIASDFLKSKLKISPGAPGAAAGAMNVTVAVTSLKDKNPQKLLFALPLLSTPTADDHVKFIMEPLTRAVQRKRTSADDRDKEHKMSRSSTLITLSEANVSRHRVAVDRVQPIIVPLREESADVSKRSAQLTHTIAAVERKIRRLMRGKERNELDRMYESGGARCYAHLPQADEHVPLSTLYDKETDACLDYVKATLAKKEGVKTDLAKISRAPTDPVLQNLYETVPAGMLEPVMKVYERLDKWDYNVFELDKATGGNALFYTTYAILHKLDLVNRFQIDDATLRAFLFQVQSGYHPNPYHNSVHAADVCHINYYILVKGGMADKCKLGEDDLLAAVLAGAIHDYDHPGFNNNFHTRTNAYLSTLYNDRSILENHHCACVFEMLRIPQFDVLATLDDENKQTFRDTIIEMVLSTDMGNHGKIFGLFRQRIDTRDWNESKKEHVRLALSISIKMADISNCARPSHLYLEWAKNISSEFYSQGDEEKKQCLLVSPFMNRARDKQDFAKGQISFMNFIVIPLLDALLEFLPTLDFVLQYCNDNKEYWQNQD